MESTLVTYLCIAVKVQSIIHFTITECSIFIFTNLIKPHYCALFIFIGNSKEIFKVIMRMISHVVRFDCCITQHYIEKEIEKSNFPFVFLSIHFSKYKEGQVSYSHA